MIDNKVINGAWFGPKALNNIHKLCIRSYQDNGHEFHLWTTHPIEGVPENTVVHDIHEIIAGPIPVFESCIPGNHPFHTVPGMGRVEMLADYFRIALIEQIGGWYVDVDTVCFRHFDFAEDLILFSETNRWLGQRNVHNGPIPSTNQVQPFITGCMFKAPAHAPFLEYIRSEATHERIQRNPHKSYDAVEEIGQPLLREAVEKFDLMRFAKAPSVFDAVDVNDLRNFISGGVRWSISPDSYSAHLRESHWASGNLGLVNINGAFPPDSLFEQLKRKHGVK